MSGFEMIPEKILESLSENLIPRLADWKSESRISLNVLLLYFIQRFCKNNL